MIDISDIHMIKVVSELGSINKAAEQLCISQPTLSKKIARLEQKLSMELFYRGNSGMLPTAAANYLLSEGDSLNTQLAVIARQLELMSGLVGGEVRVGVSPIIEQELLPNVLLDFAEQDYQFKLAVVTMSPAALLKQLQQGEIDIAIGPFSKSEIPNSLAVPLRNTGEIVASVRPGHPLSEQDRITVADMSKYKSITPNIPKGLGQQVISAQTGVEFSPSITCENYNMAKTVVINSDHISAGPEALFHNEFSSGELVKLTFDPSILWQCHCIAKPEVLLTPAVAEVVNIFSQYMEPA